MPTIIRLLGTHFCTCRVLIRRNVIYKRMRSSLKCELICKRPCLRRDRFVITQRSPLNDLATLVNWKKNRLITYVAIFNIINYVNQWVFCIKSTISKNWVSLNIIHIFYYSLFFYYVNLRSSKLQKCIK